MKITIKDINLGFLNSDMELITMPDGRHYVWPKYDTETREYLGRYSDSPAEISSHVDNRGIVVQAGGNCGYYVKQFAEMFNTVYTFEPDPLNFICLTINTNLHKNVYRYQACIGNQHEMVSMATLGTQCGAMHIGENPGLVPTMIIDDLNLPGCDLIQLDTEGFEYFGLLGARQTIEKFLPVIAVEWCQPWAERYGVTYEMITDFLRPYGYEQIARYDADRVFKVVK